MSRTDTKHLSHEAVTKQEQSSLSQTIQSDIGMRLSILAYISVIIYVAWNVVYIRDSRKHVQTVMC